jgi:hypothetical protein
MFLQAAALQAAAAAAQQLASGLFWLLGRIIGV